MKRFGILGLLIIFTTDLYSQSQNDSMGGSAVDGATDYYLQWLIIVVVLVFSVYVILRILGVYFKHKDKEKEILNEIHRVQKENWNKKRDNLTIGTGVSSIHTLTVYSDDPVVVKKYKNDNLVSSKVGFYSIDSITFDETDDTHIDDIKYYNPEEIIEAFDDKEYRYEIEPHEENGLVLSYEFKITERYLPPILSPAGVKLNKIKLEKGNHDYLYLMETIAYWGKIINLKEL